MIGPQELEEAEARVSELVSALSGTGSDAVDAAMTAIGVDSDAVAELFEKAVRTADSWPPDRRAQIACGFLHGFQWGVLSARAEAREATT